ncbi:MAG: hypothetical protein AAFO08_02370 [Pseudomonadota bacterium]
MLWIPLYSYHIDIADKKAKRLFDPGLIAAAHCSGLIMFARLSNLAISDLHDIADYLIDKVSAVKR